VISSPTPLDWLSVTAFWLRPYDAYADDYNGVTAAARPRFDETDIFGFILPMNFRNIGLNVTPWFAFANIGAASGQYDRMFISNNVDPAATTGVTGVSADDRTHAIVTGINFDFRLLDPLVIGLDVNYGQVHKANLGGLGRNTTAVPPRNGLADGTYAGTRGWYIGATLDYKLDFGSNFSVTPGIFGWWASGDSAGGVEAGQLGRLPNIGTNGGNFKPTSFGHAGYFNSIGQWANCGDIGGTATGTWGVGIQLAKATFIKDLDHTLRFAYYRGTNDSDVVRDGHMVAKYADDGLYLTTDDSVFEINFDHTYKIYENLTAALELGWLHLNSDEEVWGTRNMTGGEGKDSTNAWKAQLSFTFSF
jgi:hypothetical protein